MKKSWSLLLVAAALGCGKTSADPAVIVPNNEVLLQAASLAAPMLAARAASAAAAPRSVKLPKPVKVCIVGLHGHWGEVTTAQRMLPEIEIAAFSTTTEVELRKAGNNRALAKAKPYTNYEQMLDTEKPDAVCICDENGTRAETVIASLKAATADRPICFASHFRSIARQSATGCGSPRPKPMATLQHLRRRRIAKSGCWTHNSSS